MSSILSKLINLAGNITGTLAVANGGTGVTTSTGTGAVVLSTSPTLVTPLLGTPTSGNLANCTSYPNVTQSVAGLVSGAGQLLGTNTNDNAASGFVGETVIISRVRSSGTSLTTNTVVNIGTTTSITLGPGDYEISAMVGFTPAASTTVTEYDAAISATSATLPGFDTICFPTAGECFATGTFAAATAPVNDFVLMIPSYRVTVAAAATKTLYLVGKATFLTSTLKIYGSFQVRRAR